MRLDHILDKVISDIKGNFYDFLSIKNIDFLRINILARQLILQCDSVCIIGIGASSLNSRAIISSISKKKKKVVYLDNTNFLELSEKIDTINLNQSIFFIVSNSGNTIETYILTKYIMQEKKINPKMVYAISPSGDNLLYQLIVKYELNHIQYNKQKSGRFGIISFPYLLISAVVGVDIEQIIEEFAKILTNLSIKKTIIQKKAEWYINNYYKQRKTLIIFNYSYQLDGFYKWFQQLISESLGKQNFGITPVISRGTFDEHTLLQLYLEGPDDKFFEIIIAHLECSLSFTHLHVNNVYKALNNKGRAVKLKNFRLIDEKCIINEITEAIMLIIVLSEYFKINPFDQPSVDLCKMNLKNKFNSIV